MRTTAFFLLLTASLLTRGLEYSRDGDAVSVSTDRLRATFENGRITHLVNRRNGDVIADRSSSEPSQTAGLGRMTGKVAELSRLHFPWGTTALDQHLELGATTLYHSPGEQSRLDVENDASHVVLTYTGLGTSEGFFPEEVLQVRIGQDERGALTVKTYGKAEDGVFGVQVPV